MKINDTNIAFDETTKKKRFSRHVNDGRENGR